MRQNIGERRYTALPGWSSNNMQFLQNKQCLSVSHTCAQQIVTSHTHTHTGALFQTDSLWGSPCRFFLLMTHLPDSISPPLRPGATLSLSDNLKWCRADFSIFATDYPAEQVVEGIHKRGLCPEGHRLNCLGQARKSLLVFSLSGIYCRTSFYTLWRRAESCSPFNRAAQCVTCNVTTFQIRI